MMRLDKLYPKLRRSYALVSLREILILANEPRYLQCFESLLQLTGADRNRLFKIH